MGLVVGLRHLSEDDIRAVRDMLLRHDVTLWAVIGEKTSTQVAAAHLGLDTKLPMREARPERIERAQLAPVQPVTPEPIPAVAPQPADTSDTAMIVRRTLRSGVRLHNPGSDYHHRRRASRRGSHCRGRRGRLGQVARNGSRGSLWR